MGAYEDEHHDHDDDDDDDDDGGGHDDGCVDGTDARIAKKLLSRPSRRNTEAQLCSKTPHHRDPSRGVRGLGEGG